MSDQPLLHAIADAVAILWDEAQERASLLRFLAPFGRPDLARLERAFRTSPSIEWLLSEPWPLFGTWLAAAVVRLRLEVPQAPRSFLPRSEVRKQGLRLESGQTLVVAGDLSVPEFLIDKDARLAVAGTLTVKTLASRGLLLVQRQLRAHTIAIGELDQAHRPAERLGYAGVQVGERVVAQVLDCPRFAIACPVDCDGVIRLGGRNSNELERQRALRRLGLEAWNSDGSGLDVSALFELIQRSWR